MKAEFDGKKFSAEINQTNQNFNGNGFFGAPVDNTGIKLDKINTTLALAVVSIVLSLIMLPFGAMVNIFSDLLHEVFGVLIPEYIFVLLLTSIILMLISITLAVLSLCMYSKSAKKSSDTAAMVISIVSLVVVAIALYINLWFIVPLL